MPLRIFLILGKRSKYQHSREFFKNLMTALMDDFEGFMTSAGRCGGNDKRELEVKSEDMSELLQCHSKTEEESLLTDEQRKWFLEM